jgi:hypothetical protein
MLGCNNKIVFSKKKKNKGNFLQLCKCSNEFIKEGKVFIQINYLKLGDSVILGRFTVPAFR